MTKEFITESIIYGEHTPKPSRPPATMTAAGHTLVLRDKEQKGKRKRATKQEMSSTLRITASRANGAKSRGPVTFAGKLASLANSAKSTGPVTPEGKALSAQNALRHGILAQSIVLDSESAECFSEVLSTLQEELQPATSIESRYVETMALAEWRRLRLICLEKEQIAAETRRQEAADLSNLSNPNNNDGATEVSSIRYTALAFRALSDESRAQELLNRYESRYDRQYQRALNGLRAYRADRRKDEKESRRANRAKTAKNTTSAKGEALFCAKNKTSAKGEAPFCAENATSAKGEAPFCAENATSAKGEAPFCAKNSKSKNAKRSEPNVR